VPVATLRYAPSMLLPSGILSAKPAVDSFQVAWFNGIDVDEGVIR
jgi:hypothetical protein